MSFMLDTRPSMGGRQAFSFPQLKMGEIKDLVNALGVPVTDDELANPDKYKEQHRRMLEQLAEICTGVTREEMDQPAFSALQAGVLDYPQLHDESIPQLNSFRAVSNMMEVCGITDFSMKDFMAPSSKRLRKQLSGIINYAKFREERYNLLTDLTNTRDTLIERMNKLREKNESLNNKLSLLREQTAEESKIIAQVEDECREIETKFSELCTQQTDIREENAELKTLNNQLKDSISARTLQVCN